MRRLKIFFTCFFVLAMTFILLVACKNQEQKKESSNKNIKQDKALYTCPMHPQIIRDEPGQCPICGMDLVKKETGSPEENIISLNDLLKPANQYVVSSISTVHIQSRDEAIETAALGFITYDTRNIGIISTNFSGRIVKLYVKYRYQEIKKGQRIMDIYSPELLTAQENLLFVLKNDPGNTSLISAAKQKLLLLGMSEKQMEQVMQTGKTDFTVPVFSKYSGHIHEGSSMNVASADDRGMKDVSLITEELSIKEGMYVQKGQNIFSVYDPTKAWVVLNIYSGHSDFVKAGDKVKIIPESAPQKRFTAAISFIEPFYRSDSKTMTARVYFNNSGSHIPIGSQVNATIYSGTHTAMWLPEEAVLNLGLDKVIFLKQGDVFIAHKIETGVIQNHLVQVLNGLSEMDEVANNAQYLVDSESFIKINN